jgi:hypothetical protein
MYELEKPTQAEVDAYNERIEKFRPTYERYAAERDAFVLFPHRSVALELMLHNHGGRPAEGVKVSIRLPDGVTVVHEDDVPQEPANPVGPQLPGRPRGIHAVTHTLGGIMTDLPVPDWGSLPAIRALQPAPNVTGPRLAENCLNYGVRLLSNFDEVRLPRCFMCFPSPADVRSITLPYTVRSRSLPKLVEGELRLVVAAGAETSSEGRSEEKSESE